MSCAMEAFADVASPGGSGHAGGAKMGASVVIASAGEWGLVGVVLLMVLSIWGLYALWVLRHGTRGFAVPLPYRADRDDAPRDWASYYSEWLASNGYVITTQGPDS